MVGDKLREIRENAGMSQSAVSRATRIPQVNISYWERNKSTPNVEQARLIVSACGMKLDDLFEDKQEGKS